VGCLPWPLNHVQLSSANMKNLQAFIAGLTFTVALLLFLGVIVHFALGLDQVYTSLTEGSTSYWVALLYLLVIMVMCGFKVTAAINGLRAVTKIM